MKRSRSYELSDPRHRAAEIERLQAQARVSFAIEQEALVEHGLAERRSLLDLGCGQASFLSLIAERFPELRCAGADRNEGLLEVARAQPGVSEVARCDIADPAALSTVLQRLRPDVVLCRFVLQHMSPPERARLLATLRAFGATRAILADVDADQGYFDPPSELLAHAQRKLTELQARLGGDRRIGGKLGALLREAGFAEVRESSVAIDSARTGFSAWWGAFGPVLAAGLLDQPTVRETVLDWGADASTASRYRASFPIRYASAS